MDAAACIRMISAQCLQATAGAGCVAVIAAYKAGQQQQLFLLPTLAVRVHRSTGLQLLKAQDPAVVEEVLASRWPSQSP